MIVVCRMVLVSFPISILFLTGVLLIFCICKNKYMYMRICNIIVTHYKSIFWIFQDRNKRKVDLPLFLFSSVPWFWKNGLYVFNCSSSKSWFRSPLDLSHRGFFPFSPSYLCLYLLSLSLIEVWSKSSGGDKGGGLVYFTGGASRSVHGKR